MWSRTQQRLIVLGWVSAAGLLAQEAPLPGGSVSINLSKDSPVTLVTMNSGQSSVTARGAAIVLNLHMDFTLRNDGSNRIHGVMLRVVSQEATPGGKGSVTYPSLNVGPGEVFPVRIDMQLVRPTQVAAGPLAQVDLDGVLYQDLSFYGPDRLHSKRYLTACELEAQRDREYFKRVLAQSGREGLRQQILQSGARQRQTDAAPLNVRVVRSGPSVTSAGLPAEHSAKFALVQFPDAPVELVEGSAQIAGNEARAPHIDVVNRSGKAVKYLELGWVLSDPAGRQSVAAALPSPERDLYLAPGKRTSVLQETTLRLFSNSGQPANVQGLTGFINEVEFVDGKVWVPSRLNLDALGQMAPPSAEEQRLFNVYLKKNIDGLIEELKKF
ncbi:MAG TPA: hypothetical protein VMH81_37790 [Bryobacteraceae bacterium]|nr:hypothetical protein [Bryobacteraceae bacterium]